MTGIGSAQQLRLEVLTPPGEAVPRQAVTLGLAVHNESPDSWRGSARPQLPQGWRLLVPPEELALEEGETGRLFFTVVAPPTAAAGEYRLAVTLVGAKGAPEGEAVFAVRVRRVARVGISLLAAPRFVLSEPYTARFAVRNEGNVGLELKLSVTDNLQFPLTVGPAILRLAASEAAEVTVSVDVPPGLERSATHTLSLSAQASDDPLTRASHFLGVELVPTRPSGRTALHTFPLRVRFSSGLDATTSGTSSARLGVPQIHVFGTGALWDKDPGSFSVSFKNAVDFSRHENLVTYQRHDFRIAAGDQTFSLSPLLPGPSGFGLDARGAFRPWPAAEVAGHAFAYDNRSGTGLGARASLELGSQAVLAANALLPFGSSAPVVAGQLELSPDIGGDGVLTLDLEYARRLADAGSAAAFSVRGSAGTQHTGLDLAWRQSAAGYDQHPYDRASFRAGGRVRLVGPTLQAPLQAGLSAWYDRQRSYPAGGLLAAEPVFFRNEVGGAVNGAWQDVRWSARYDGFDTADSTTGTSEHSNGLLFSVGFPVGGELVLRQALSWRRSLTHESSEADHLLGYGASAAIPLKEGRLEPYASLEWSVSASRFEKLEGGLSWLGGARGLHSTSLRAAYEPLAAERFRLSASGEFRFDNRHSLELGAQGRLDAGGDPSLQLSMAYALPLAVPIGRRSDVGGISGRIEDASGRGVAGLIVHVAGLAASTQADGSFFFPAVPAGEHHLALDSNRAANRLTVPESPYEVSVRAGETQHLDFTLVEPARVRGRVHVEEPATRDSDANAARSLRLGGEPAANPLQGLLVELRNGGTTYRTVTDHEGRFGFERVLPGRWRLVVAEQGLRGRFHVEPLEQTLELRAGEVAEAVIELTRIERRIEIAEGGVLQPTADGGNGNAPMAPDAQGDVPSPPPRTAAAAPAAERAAQPKPQEPRTRSEELVLLPESDAELSFRAPSKTARPGAAIVLHVGSAREIARIDVSSYRLSLVAANKSQDDPPGWQVLVIPAAGVRGELVIPLRITFVDGDTLVRTLSFEIDPSAPAPAGRP